MNVRLIALAVVLTIAVGACGDSGDSGSQVAGSDELGSTSSIAIEYLFDNDFEDACLGAPVTDAAAYAASAPGIHPVLILQGAKGELISTTSELPETWTRTFAEGKNNLAEIELVACSIRNDGDVVQECDGYEDSDGNKTDQVVKLRNATYDVSLREAATGKEVATTTVEATSDTCPYFVSADDEEYFATNETAIVEFISEYVQVG